MRTHQTPIRREMRPDTHMRHPSPPSHDGENRPNSPQTPALSDAHPSPDPMPNDLSLGLLASADGAIAGLVAFSAPIAAGRAARRREMRRIRKAEGRLSPSTDEDAALGAAIRGEAVEPARRLPADATAAQRAAVVVEAAERAAVRLGRDPATVRAAVALALGNIGVVTL